MFSPGAILDTVCGTLVDIYSAIPFIGDFLVSITSTVCGVIGGVFDGLPF